MTNRLTYKQAEEYILSIPKFTKKNIWEKTRDFYEFLGKPGKGSKIIHVAGTNGKGSVCAYMASCLKEGGYSVGMFTSPHLVSMRERIRLNGEMISEKEFLETFHQLGAMLETYQKKECGEDNKIQSASRHRKKEAYHPAFFEWLFFLAMLFFEKKCPQVIILETGLGGRLDATNVIDPPAVCVITRIGLDHMEYLGNTCGQIAGEKAGIIKPGSRVIYSTMRQESEQVIERKAAECGCSYRKMKKEEEWLWDLADKGIDFSFYSRYYGYIPLNLTSKALYQLENAALALGALEEAEFRLSPEILQAGVKKCKWEGRMEEILPGVFLDGAHNQDGIEAFLESVQRDGCRGKRWLLFSVVADKEYEIIKKQILEKGLFHQVYVAPLENERSLTRAELENLFEDCGVLVLDGASRGLEEILSLMEQEDLVYVAGSLYLVGEVKAYFSVNRERCRAASWRIE